MRRAFQLLAVTILPFGYLSPGPFLAGKPEAQADLPQVGAARPLRLVPELGRFVRTGTGLSWRDEIQLPGAAFLKPRYSGFNLAPGDVLIVRGSSGQVVEELRGLGPGDAGSFWGLAAFGDELHFELRARGRYTRPPFEIEQVIVGDPQLLAAVAGGESRSVCAPEDFDDAICYQGDAAKWANVLASAGVITTGGGVASWCSAVNVSPQNYLLTNYHCIPQAGSCASSEFLFKYYRTACNSGAPATADWVSYRCKNTVASSPLADCEPGLASLDYSLSSVFGDPAGSFGFTRPDPTPLTSGERVYLVQHPGGRPHEITEGEGADLVVSGHTLRYFGSLDTEDGSDGAPMFRDSDDQLVGLHHCGGCEDAGVGNRGMLMADIYPAISPYVCTAGVVFAAADPAALFEVAGNGDVFLDPGETWSLRPVLRNRSCATAALAVTANVAVSIGSAALTVLDTAVSFGDIAAGRSATASQAVRFTISAAAPCVGQVALKLVALTSGGGVSHPDSEFFRQALGSLPRTNLLSENFAGGLPGSWTLVHGGSGSGSAATWTTTNPGGRSLLVPPFAIADSDQLGSGFTMDEQLITPAVATTSFGHITLELEHAFSYYEPGQAEIADIDVRSAATGNNWQNLSRLTASAAGHVSLDLTPYSAANLQVRFHYSNAQYELYWAIDDITIRADNGQVCAAGPFFRDGFEAGNTAAWSLTVP